MDFQAIRPKPVGVRRPFESWSVVIPETFIEACVPEGGYWHAYDATRSVSLSSIVLTDADRPVPAAAIVREMSPANGAPVNELPPDLLGWAVERDAIQPARASRALTGMLAADGRVLIVTITSDDLEWARRTWLTIRAHLPPATASSARARTN